MIRLDAGICTDFEEASSREWLETNGIGGFASGTVSGANTRRYHALLTAATRPPLGRVTMVSKVEEALIVAGDRFDLSANRFPGSISPAGYRLLTGFRLDPFPIWTYRVEDIELERSVFMPHGADTTVIRWRLLTPAEDVRLEVRPLISAVDYHHIQRQDASFDGGITRADGRVTMRPYPELPELLFAHNGMSVETTGHWYHNFELAIEKERGFDYHEDLFQPFAVTFDLNAPAAMIISTEQANAADANVLAKKEVKRRKTLTDLVASDDPAVRRLVLAADQFVVRRGEGYTVIAGYPWFSDWGRDTMIALPGLALATNRHDIARGILTEFAGHVSQGMLPNRFPDEGEQPDYNTVDATLWYFEAIRAYVEETGDHHLVQQTLYGPMSEIITWHLRGTRYGIHVDTDGLLYAGEAGHQLTWMDAKIGDRVITPRIGKPVEIQALWYNALRVISDLADRFGHDDDRERFEAMADLAKLSFNGLFWNEETGCLYDVVNDSERDPSVRPNQLLAISLAHPILEKTRWRSVMEKVRSELLTPVGLRSLSPTDPEYVGTYIGSPLERDSAYHQGTVWGWLIGPYADAYRKTFDHESDLAADLIGFERHLLEAGLGQVSEIFDGAAPHAPRGCPAQAWSVAELLRTLLLNSR